MIHARFKLTRSDFTLEANMQIPSRGVTALFGPSGSGKTTLLRCIAGLERAEGSLHVNEEIWQDKEKFLPVHRRPLGFVFQEANLFPHLSVRHNLEYGLNRIQPEERKVKFEQVVEWLGLDKIMDRKNPTSLSGGERQRVAIGRALLTSPHLLLMDEPLSSLDTAGKQEILPYLEQIHRELEIPVLYVSHALDEVARLADHIVILENGRVAASGALNETLTRLDLSTSRLDDAGAVIEAFVAVHDDTYSLTQLDFLGESLWVTKVNREVGSPVRARILARDVSIALIKPQATSISNILSARVGEILEVGADRVSLQLEIGNLEKKQILLSRITRRSRDQLGLTAGMNVFAQVKSVALIM